MTAVEQGTLGLDSNPCRDCGAPIPYFGRGRRREVCDQCRPEWWPPLATNDRKAGNGASALDTARTERDRAMERVAHAAPAEWKTTAWAWLLDYLASHPTFFPDDAWSEGLEEPPEARAWGPIVQRAAREGLIVRTGEMRQRTRGHATRADVWRSTIFRGEG